MIRLFVVCLGLLVMSTPAQSWQPRSMEVIAATFERSLPADTRRTLQTYWRQQGWKDSYAALESANVRFQDLCSGSSPSAHSNVSSTCLTDAFSDQLARFRQTQPEEKAQQAEYLSGLLWLIMALHDPTLSAQDNLPAQPYVLEHGKPMERFDYWQGGVLGNVRDPQRLAAGGLQKHSRYLNQWRVASLYQVVEESRSLANNVQAPATNPLSRRKQVSDQRVLQQRITQAGVRAAHLITLLIGEDDAQ